MVQAGGDCVNVLDECCNRFWAPWVCFFCFVCLFFWDTVVLQQTVESRQKKWLPVAVLRKTFSTVVQKEEAAKTHSHMQGLKPFSCNQISVRPANISS